MFTDSTNYFNDSQPVQESDVLETTSETSAESTLPIESIRGLALRGTNLTPDQLELSNYELTKDDVEALCQELTDYAKAAPGRPTMTYDRLLAMRIIWERNGRIVPTYAYNILAGVESAEIMMNIQCGVFRGTGRNLPIDSLECTDPIYRQIGQAMQFVLRSIRIRYEVRDRAQRYEIYEFPVETIRELIVNAVCHRSYFIQSHVQIALYDDRLEIVSPGMLLPELTLDQIRHGQSIVRNRSLASMFRYLGLMEQWGIGIPKAIESCLEYGLQEPVLEASGSAFIVSIYRKDPILPC